MANCCIAGITLISDEDGLADDAIIKQIEEALANIDHCGSGRIFYNDDHLIEWHGNTAWAFPEMELRKIARTFGVKIRAVGREDDHRILTVFCVDEQGDVVTDETIISPF